MWWSLFILASSLGAPCDSLGAAEARRDRRPAVRRPAAASSTRPAARARSPDSGTMLRQAVAGASRAIALNPGQAEGFAVRAAANAELGKNDLALEDLREASLRDPRYLPILRTIEGPDAGRAAPAEEAPGTGGVANPFILLGLCFVALAVAGAGVVGIKAWRARRAAGAMGSALAPVMNSGPPVSAPAGASPLGALPDVPAAARKSLPKAALSSLLDPAPKEENSPSAPESPAPAAAPAAPAWTGSFASDAARTMPLPNPFLPMGSSARAPAMLPPAAAPLRPEAAGDTVGGRYRRLEIFRRGPLGSLWTADDTVSGQTVVLKRMVSEGSVCPPENRRVLLENARRIAALDHPSIAKLIEVVDHDSGPLLVYELVPGRPLDEVTRASGGIKLGELRWVMKCVCEALVYANRQGIAHLNLKPSNILLPFDGAAKLSDFRVLAPALTGAPGEAYLAPELAQGKANSSSDVFSLGNCLRDMLGGASAISVEAGQLIERATSPRPERRYPDAGAFYAALELLPDAQLGA